MGHFLDMGGYARFVWPAYALAAVVFAWNIIAACRLFNAALTRASRAAIAARSSTPGRTP